MKSKCKKDTQINILNKDGIVLKKKRGDGIISVCVLFNDT